MIYVPQTRLFLSASAMMMSWWRFHVTRFALLFGKIPQVYCYRHHPVPALESVQPPRSIDYTNRILTVADNSDKMSRTLSFWRQWEAATRSNCSKFYWFGLKFEQKVTKTKICEIWKKLFNQNQIAKSLFSIFNFNFIKIFKIVSTINLTYQNYKVNLYF